MAADATAMVEYDRDPLVFVTTYSWQNGTETERVRKSNVPPLVKMYLRFGIDFSVTRNP